MLKIELRSAYTRALARRLLFGSVVPLGNWFRASLNFYSLLGTDDKKIAQTENQSVFLILLHLLPSFFSFHPSFFTLFSLLLSSSSSPFFISNHVLLAHSFFASLHFSPFLDSFSPPFARCSPRQSFTLSSMDLA